MTKAHLPVISGVLLATTLSAAAASIDWPQLDLIEVASGISGPTSIAAAPDGSGRLFATEQRGRVMLIESNTVTPFLDLRDRVQYFAGSESGLLSVAFSPGFVTNRNFYVFYNALSDGSSTISRFQVSSTNANVADASTEQIVLTVPPNFSAPYTLSGGLLLFGLDGFLYIGMGDTGFGEFAPNQAQNGKSLRGKILRLDVQGVTNGYQIPHDNPFLADTNYLPEIWAVGVRNPWRFSFDRMTGDFYMGDVGQVESEEVNFKAGASAAGQNFGWPIREGLHLYAGPESSSSALTDPIIELLHAGPPASITGGFVYRESSQSRMTGCYFYADAYSGRIFALARNGSNWLNQVVATVPYFITTFGEDEAGRLYLADYITGTIYRIEDNGAVAAPTFDPPGTNSSTVTITISCISTNAIIRYTTNGVDPGSGDPFVSSGGAVVIGSNTVLKARAYRNDLLPSPVTSMRYNLKVARPTFSPAHSVTNGQPLAIICSTAGAEIRFSTNGADPTATSSLYSSPIIFTNGVTLKARAFKSGFVDSSVGVFSPSVLVLQNFNSSQEGIFNSFSYQSLPDWFFQVQVAEDPAHWRDFGSPEPGTNGVVIYHDNNVYPAPARRMYRLKAFEDPGL